MRHLTIRNLPAEIAEALEEERHRSRSSLNQAVIGSQEESNDLGRLAGTWTQKEFERFEAAVALTEQIDREFWR